MIVDHAPCRVADHRGIGDLGQASAFDDRVGRRATFGHLLKNLFRRLAADRACIDERNQSREHLRLDSEVAEVKDLVADPVGGRFRVAAARHRLEIVRELARRDERLRFGRRNSHGDVSLDARLWHFRQRSRDIVDPCSVDLQREEIRLRKVPVVVRLFLRSHGARFAGGRIEEASLLFDAAA